MDRPSAAVAGSDVDDLEPLFNYERVLPSNLLAFDDDAYDCSPISPDSKRRRTTDALGTEPKAKGAVAAVVLDLDDDEEGVKGKEVEKADEIEEEDWLTLPPRKAPSLGLPLEEDKLLKQLRQKKQELSSFAQSAKDVVRQATEAAKQELINSSKTAPVIILDEPSKPQVQRPKIVISIQDKGGQKQFRVFSDDKFERLFKMYAEKAALKIENLVFSFDGDKISPSATPEGLGMENDDIIEVHMKS